MIELTLQVKGKTVDDMMVALEQAMNRIRDGYTDSRARSGRGEYSFHVTWCEEMPVDNTTKL